MPGLCGATAVRHGELLGGIDFHHPLLLCALPRPDTAIATGAGKQNTKQVSLLCCVGEPIAEKGLVNAPMQRLCTR